jgi:hypothetical protein
MDKHIIISHLFNSMSHFNFKIKSEFIIFENDVYIFLIGPSGNGFMERNTVNFSIYFKFINGFIRKSINLNNGHLIGQLRDSNGKHIFIYKNDNDLSELDYAIDNQIKKNLEMFNQEKIQIEDFEFFLKINSYTSPKIFDQILKHYNCLLEY